MHPKFQVFQSDKNSQHYFRLLSGNAESTLHSEGYTTKDNCLNGVNSVKRNAPNDGNYDRLTARNGQFYFNLKSAHNGQVIGTSEMYVSRQGRDNGIEAVKRDAPIAQIEDLTAQRRAS